jgi:hypothetical protein
MKKKQKPSGLRPQAPPSAPAQASPLGLRLSTLGSASAPWAPPSPSRNTPQGRAGPPLGKEPPIPLPHEALLGSLPARERPLHPKRALGLKWPTGPFAQWPSPKAGRKGRKTPKAPKAPDQAMNGAMAKAPAARRRQTCLGRRPRTNPRHVLARAWTSPRQAKASLGQPLQPKAGGPGAIFVFWGPAPCVILVSTLN